MCKLFKLRRNTVSALTFVGVLAIFVMRANLSVAIVDMTVEHVIEHQNGTSTTFKYFNWNSKERGNVLGAFYYGYVCAQIIAGYLATKYGGATIFGLGLGITSLLTLLTPICAKLGDVYAVVILRTLEGFITAGTFPAIQVMWSKWSPPAETTKHYGISCSGASLGIVVAFGCGFIVDVLGWSYAFYVPGVAGLIWYIIWYLNVTNDPRDDPYISTYELNHLKQNLRDKDETISHPWKKILTSIPVWAMITAGCCENWGGYIMQTQLPMYLKDRYNYTAGKAGFLLTLPYMVNFVLSIVAGVIADKLRKRRFTSTQVRKMCSGFAFVGEGLFTALIGYVDSPVLAIICLTAKIGISSFTVAGHSVNAQELAPQYVGVITGIKNTFTTMTGAICPNVAGYIVTTGSLSEWRYLFLQTASVYIIGILVYCTFASGELQPWANDDVKIKDYLSVQNEKERAKITHSKEENV